MMRFRLRWWLSFGAAIFAGLVAAIGMGSAGAATQTVTVGSTTGTPNTNAADCFSPTKCTYVPFSSVTTPETQVPFNGTVTSFSVNSGSAGGTVWLRVLRPAPGGQFTGVGTSQAETLTTGVNTFTTSLAVKAGDLLALDNDSSALIFDTSNPAAITSYYMPALTDGQSLAPNENQAGIQPLFSATVQSAPATTTGPGTTVPVTTSTSTTGPGTSSSHPTPAPALSRVGESHRVWSEQAGAGGSSHPQTPPAGTTFSFSLNQAARVHFTFEQQLTGRKVKGRCVAQTPLNRTRHACVLAGRPRSLSVNGHSGRNSVSFRGRLSSTSKLPAGRYTLSITAVNSAGRKSRSARLAFTIV